VTLLRGPETGVVDVHPTLTGDPFDPNEPPEPAINDLERAVDSIVLMKNLSELAVDLAYGSVLFDNEALAEEVSNLEIEVDALQSRFEAWTLRAAQEADDPVSLRGLIHLGVATERSPTPPWRLPRASCATSASTPSWRWRSKSPTDHHPDRDRRGEQPRRHPDRERNPRD